MYTMTIQLSLNRGHRGNEGHRVTEMGEGDPPRSFFLLVRSPRHADVHRHVSLEAPRHRTDTVRLDRAGPAGPVVGTAAGPAAPRWQGPGLGAEAGRGAAVA